MGKVIFSPTYSPTFSDFAFLALCTNLRPSFLAYQIEANIAMPMEGIHNAACCTNNFPPRLRDPRKQAGAVTGRLLLSQFLSCWLAEGEGGRREGLRREGRPVWPGCRYIYILPAGGPGEAGAAFPASSHTQPVRQTCLQFLGTAATTLHVCQEEGKPQSPRGEAAHLQRWARQRRSSLGLRVS